MQPYALFPSTQSPNPVGLETTKPDFRMPVHTSSGNQSESRDGEINESAVEIMVDNFLTGGPDGVIFGVSQRHILAVDELFYFFEWLGIYIRDTIKPWDYPITEETRKRKRSNSHNENIAEMSWNDTDAALFVKDKTLLRSIILTILHFSHCCEDPPCQTEDMKKAFNYFFSVNLHTEEDQALARGMFNDSMQKNSLILKRSKDIWFMQNCVLYSAESLTNWWLSLYGRRLGVDSVSEITDEKRARESRDQAPGSFIYAKRS